MAKSAAVPRKCECISNMLGERQYFYGLYPLANLLSSAFNILIFVFTLLATAIPLSASTLEGDWFLQAGASGSGESIDDPTGSPAIIERLSAEGDTIVLLPSDAILEGGLTLKKHQSLIGISKSGRKPVITNRNPDRNNGCGIMLADGNRVLNLRIENTLASGLYGLEISSAQIDGVDVHGSNQQALFIEASYLTLPGQLPHGGMVFMHSQKSDLSPDTGSDNVSISSSTVTESAGFGIAAITSGNSHSSLLITDTIIENGSRIGFFDAGISSLAQGSGAQAQLEIIGSEVQGRMSRAGRNVMVVASGGAKAIVKIKNFLSGPVGQDGIVGAVMQSPSQISMTISESIVEGAGQMNIEGSLINLPPNDPSQANQARVSINIQDSIIRNAGAVSGFENIAANVWLGPSLFLKDQPPAIGEYELTITNSQILDAGRAGLEFGDLELLHKDQLDKSKYNVVLIGNTIKENGEADLFIHAPRATIDARKNCWGYDKNATKPRVKIHDPSKLSQLNVSQSIRCE